MRLAIGCSAALLCAAIILGYRSSAAAGETPFNGDVTTSRVGGPTHTYVNAMLTNLGHAWTQADPCAGITAYLPSIQMSYWGRTNFLNDPTYPLTCIAGPGNLYLVSAQPNSVTFDYRSDADSLQLTASEPGNWDHYPRLLVTFRSHMVVTFTLNNGVVAETSTVSADQIHVSLQNPPADDDRYVSYLENRNWSADLNAGLSLAHFNDYLARMPVFLIMNGFLMDSRNAGAPYDAMKMDAAQGLLVATSPHPPLHLNPVNPAAVEIETPIPQRVTIPSAAIATPTSSPKH